EYFGLSLYKGKAMHAKNLISPEVARGLESEVERVQVTVRVYTGDYFNLSDMTYTPALR
ncbi:MAG: hypothetical protein QG563_508, partial [Patescibacteria group bacterium]|nr:hypothetical protein [Patescibacteria group bacterium]